MSHPLKRGVNLRVIIAVIFLLMLSLSWRYLVNARSTAQHIDPLAPQPHIVIFNLNHDNVDLPSEHLGLFETINQGLYEGFAQSSRCSVVTSSERDTLLDPAWTKNPSSSEEALELGREVGADWALKGVISKGNQFYRIELKLIALKPPPLLPTEFKTDLPPLGLIDFNTLNAQELEVAQHLIWVIRPEVALTRMRKVARLMISKAHFNLKQRQQKLKEEIEKQKELYEESAKSSPQTVKHEEKTREITDAVQRELNAIQARIEAEYTRHEREIEMKRQVLSGEAAQAWAKIEAISGGAGLKTVKVIYPPQETLPPYLRKIIARKRKLEGSDQVRIKPARSTWEEIQVASRYSSETQLEDYKSKLLSFMRTYRDLTDYHPHITEAQHRYTWLNRAQIEWVKIYGRSFRMGALATTQDSQPIRWIDISNFQVSRSEVTNAQYKRCVDAGACTPPHWDDLQCEIQGERRSDRAPLPAQMRRGDLPVVCINWEQARRYAAWVGGRLLSESEWEFLARSGEGYFNYPWGTEQASCQRAVISNSFGHGCGFKSALPVCSKVAGNNKMGICDLAGNVWEWVEDSYVPNLATIPLDGSPFTQAGAKVVRGGSFTGDYREVYASTRGQLDAKSTMNVVGFRVARAFDPEGNRP